MHNLLRCLLKKSDDVGPIENKKEVQIQRLHLLVML